MSSTFVRHVGGDGSHTEASPDGREGVGAARNHCHIRALCNQRFDYSKPKAAASSRNNDILAVEIHDLHSIVQIGLRRMNLEKRVNLQDQTSLPEISHRLSGETSASEANLSKVQLGLIMREGNGDFPATANRGR